MFAPLPLFPTAFGAHAHTVHAVPVTGAVEMRERHVHRDFTNAQRFVDDHVVGPAALAVGLIRHSAPVTGTACTVCAWAPKAVGKRGSGANIHGSHSDRPCCARRPPAWSRRHSSLSALVDGDLPSRMSKLGNDESNT